MFESEIGELHVAHAAQLRARQAQQTFETAGRQQQRDVAEPPAAADAPAHNRYASRLRLIIELKSCVEPAEQQRPRLQVPMQLFELHIAKTRRLRTALPHAAANAGENHRAAEARRRPFIDPGGGDGGDEEHAVQHHAEHRIKQCPFHEPSRLSVMRAFTRPTCSRRSPARSTLLPPKARCKRPSHITRSSNAACSSTTRTTLLTVIDEAVQQAQLQPAVRRIQPEGSSMVRVVLEQAAFDDMVMWLGRLQRAYGVSIVDLAVDRREQGGRVNARVTLKREGS